MTTNVAVAADSREMRGSSVARIVLGGLLIYGSLASGQGSAPLTLRYELTFFLALVGMAMMIFGFVHLYRRKGDYDDFDESKESAGEDIPKSPEDNP